MHLQDSLHLSQRLIGFDRTGTDCLGAVHAGTAAETDDGITAFLVVKLQGFADIDSSRVGNCFVINGIGDTGLL